MDKFSCAYDAICFSLYVLYWAEGAADEFCTYQSWHVQIDEPFGCIVYVGSLNLSMLVLFICISLFALFVYVGSLHLWTYDANPHIF